jgi:hypothetical protein
MRAGGLLFPDVAFASDFANEEMYRDTEGLLPKAPGTFADAKIDGLAIYRPLARSEPTGA